MLLGCILHVEDEPSKNSSAPRLLKTDLEVLIRNRDYHLAGYDETDDDTEFVFDFRHRLEDMAARLTYHLLEDQARFESALERLASHHIVLAIFDAFSGGAAFGVECYCRAIGRLPAESVLFYTAYPGSAAMQLGWSRDDPRILEKPASRKRLAQIINEKTLAWLAHALSP